MRINIKPLSVNQCWQGKRFKTKVYKDYEKELLLKLKPLKVSKDKKLCLEVTFGFSNSGSDLDNPLKPFEDILQKKYGVNDKNIYKLIVSKEVVKKGNEFIDFDLYEIEEI